MPGSTISRLLVRLRERLDERCDGRGAWCAAVLAVPLAGPAGPVPDATTGGTSTMVECAEESMYAYVGDAPDVPFERTFRFGMRVGAAKPKPEHDGKVFRYNMTKRIDDLRTCSEGDTRGFVELKVELPEGSASPKAVSIVSTDVDDDVAQCFRETVAGWKHFATIAAETRTHRYVLPLPE